MPTGIAQTLQKRLGDSLAIELSFADELTDADGNTVDALDPNTDNTTVTVRRTKPTLLLDESVADKTSVTIPLDQEHKLFVEGFERLIVKGVPESTSTLNGAIEDLTIFNPNVTFRLKPDVGEVGEDLFITIAAQRKERGPTEKVIKVEIRD